MMFAFFAIVWFFFSMALRIAEDQLSFIPDPEDPPSFNLSNWVEVLWL
jgi:hypothetical protein